MRLELVRSGGLAARVLVRPIVLDTDDLDPQEAGRVETIVAAASACVAEGGLEQRPARWADSITYRVSVSPGPMGSLTFHDPLPHPALAALVDVIVELGHPLGS